jgi:protein-S-isoprenylcysteine O-methyltransferase Ste14
MLAVYLGLGGLVAFVGGVVIFGTALKRHGSKATAERYSRIMHGLFFAGLGAPFLVSLASPGITQLDALAGLPGLPMRPFFLAAGIVLAIPGLYLMADSNTRLRDLGSGANAFRLTERVVVADTYHYTRNPMSLGYYMLCLSIACLAGSTLLGIYVVVGVIPAHIFFLKFFEERELALRFGASYLKYQRTAPFLLPSLTALFEKPSTSSS